MSEGLNKTILLLLGIGMLLFWLGNRVFEQEFGNPISEISTLGIGGAGQDNSQVYGQSTPNNIQIQEEELSKEQCQVELQNLQEMKLQIEEDRNQLEFDQQELSQRILEFEENQRRWEQEKEDLNREFQEKRDELDLKEQELQKRQEELDNAWRIYEQKKLEQDLQSIELEKNEQSQREREESLNREQIILLKLQERLVLIGLCFIFINLNLGVLAVWLVNRSNHKNKEGQKTSSQNTRSMYENPAYRQQRIMEARKQEQINRKAALSSTDRGQK